MGSDRPSNFAPARQLFDQCAPALVLYARTWLGAADAEDAVQEAFVRYLSQPAPRPDEPRAWLFRVVRNLAITRLRRRRPTAGGAEYDLLAAEDRALASAAEVNRALRQLPEAERETVVLRLWGGLTLEQIGQVTGTSTATAFRNYQRALASIRERLEKPCTTQPKTPATKA